MMKKAVRHLLIPILAVSFILPMWFPAYAASCGRSNEEDLDERYDDYKDDFDDEVDEQNIDGDIRDIRSEITRRTGRGGGSSALDAALRRVRGSIDQLDDEGDRIYERYRNLSTRSSFEDCGDEIADKARDLRDYIRDKVREYRDDVRELVDDADDLEDRRRDSASQIRAPVWHWGQETPSEEVTPEPAAPPRPVQQEEQRKERTSADIQKEIHRLFIQVQALIVEFAKAKRREQAQANSV